MLLGALVLGTAVGCGSADDEAEAVVGGEGGSGGEGGEGGSGGSAGEDEGDGGSGGGAGKDDPGPVHCDDTRAEGEAVESPGDHEWLWVNVPGAKCRDGSDTGFAINFSSSSKEVMIFLEGGGACFNGTTCMGNPKSFNEGNFNAAKAGLGGILDRTRDENPVKDWNYVYIPYCTGDVHAGNKTDVEIKGAGKQQFLGYANIGLYLKQIVPSFPEAERVLLTGVSAGGFGAAANYDQVQRGFGCTPVDLLDDSGPPMAKEFVPACLQNIFRTSWGLDETMLADCGEDCQDKDDFLLDFVMHLAKTHPERTQGLISSTADATIRQFYGFSANDCKAVLPNMSATTFGEGLLDAREKLASFDSFGSYIFDGSSHTMIGGSGFYSKEVNDVSLRDWVADLLDGTPSHVGPEGP